jgi:type IV pilus assembly protein PilM
MRAGIGPRPWVGLDVGTYSVKVCSLTPEPGGGPRIGESLVEGPFDGHGGRPPAAIAPAIADAFSQAGIALRSGFGLTLGVSGPDVVVRQISLPMLADDEIGPALRFEARKHLPFDPQSLVLDHQVIARRPAEKRLEVLLAAASQERLQRVEAPLAMLNLKADIVDAVPLALANALAASEGLDGPDPLVLLDIGHTHSHLTVWQPDQPFFSRRLEFGGRHLTRAIAEAGGMDEAQAEEWKLSAAARPARPGPAADGPELRAATEALRRDLAEELQRSFVYYRTLGSLPEPLGLRLCGGASRLPGLPARLSEMLGMPVAMFDPLAEDPAAGPGERSPQFAVAAGLARRTG